MTTFRPVIKVVTSHPTRDGAGVRLRRAFSHSDAEHLDPVLMLDHFASDNPNDFIMGFPMHPHRGIETVTYVLEGEIEHTDSLGNGGVIGRGDVQWMTAGSGIMHQEMPRGTKLNGFQLWVNLPKANKMMPPRYREVLAKNIREIAVDVDCSVKVIAGHVRKVDGPVKDLVVPVELLDVNLEPMGRLDHEVPRHHTCLAFVYHGQASFGPDAERIGGAEQLVVLDDGEIVTARAGPGGAKFLLASGPPLLEPIAWGGPIVMNTKEELEQAFIEIETNSFIKG